MTLFVDDGLSATNDLDFYNKFIADFGKRFELGEEGQLSWYLGMLVTQDLEKGTTKLSQCQYVLDILERFDMTGCNPAQTPMDPNLRLSKSDSPPILLRDAERTLKYQQLVESLMYLSSWTRGDISFAVNQCARFMANPGPAHMDAAKRILRYLAGTADLWLHYSVQDDEMSCVLWGYADADHAGDIDTRRSVTGYTMMMSGAAIQWQSTRQAITALSSSEAEFYAASVAGCDVVYLRALCDGLGLPQGEATTVFEDNWACIHLSQNSLMFHRSKHINVLVYNLWDLCNAETMILEKIDTGEQAADILTKALPQPAFIKHRNVMLGKQVLDQ